MRKRSVERGVRKAPERQGWRALAALPPGLHHARLHHAGLHQAGLLLAGLVLSGCGGDAGNAAAEGEVLATAGHPARDAEFVGGATCATCHQEIDRLYQETSKRRSVSRFRLADAPERLPGEVVHHQTTNLSYEAFARGDTLFQREFRLAGDGTLVHEAVYPAAYVIGSGNATRSYLMDVGGYVTEMPLTWYAEREAWDMSPGYEDANDRFSRKINLECLTCHTDFPEQSRFTQNHYVDVPTGITCERCHGPGGDHVALRAAGGGGPRGGEDSTIVHPGRLSRDAQLSICQQCHLAGVTVFREGGDPTTFRPGESLYSHRTVFVPNEQLTDPDWVGIDSHPLRLARSACYQATEMTCTTCHAPHAASSALEPDAYNRSCVGCHAPAPVPAAGAPGAERGAGSVAGTGAPAHLCSRPDAEGAQAAAEGDCVGCHMSRGGTSDVPHVRFTDHWIRRDPGPPLDPSEGRPAFDSPSPIPLVALQQEGRSAHILAARTTATPLDDLEVAAAYFHFYETMHRQRSYVRTVVDHARRGMAGGADHPEARIALGRALADMDSLAAAERVLREATVAYPEDPWTHFWLGAVLEEQGREEAVEPLQRAVEIQPAFIEAQVKLADALFGAGRMEEALARLERIVALDPVHQPRAWYNIGVIRVSAGDAAGAARALEEAARADPDLVDAHVLVGSIRMNEGRLDDAEARFRRALAADPESISAHGSLGLVELRRGRPDEARRHFERVLELDPGNEDVLELLRQTGG